MDDIFWRWVRPLISLSAGSTAYSGLFLLGRSILSGPQLDAIEAELRIRLLQMELLLGVMLVVFGMALTMLRDLATACRPERLAQCFMGFHLLLAVLPAWQAGTFRAWPFGSFQGWSWIVFHGTLGVGFFLCAHKLTDPEQSGTISTRQGFAESWLLAPSAAIQEERQRLARDLHDSIKQQIFSVKMSAAAAEARWEDDPAGARSALADIRRSAQAAMVEMQALLGQLRPETVVMEGLVEALREQSEALGYRSGAQVVFELGDLPPDDRLPPSVREQLFRIAQEALSNVARHARAHNVHVWLGTTETSEGSFVVLRVRDDGQGFDSSVGASGMGLRNIQERVVSLQGRLVLESSPGNGTEMRVYLALHALREQREGRRQTFAQTFPSLLSLGYILFALYSPDLSTLALAILMVDLSLGFKARLPVDSDARLARAVYLMLWSWFILVVWTDNLNRAVAGGLIVLPIALTLWVAWTFFLYLRKNSPLGGPAWAGVVVLAVMLSLSLACLLWGVVQGEVDRAGRISLISAVAFYGGWWIWNWKRRTAKP